MKKFTLFLSLLFAIVSIQAQDYLISFAGTGASTTVGTVKVENLTQKKSLTLNGSEVLHLVAIDTGIDPILDNENALRIFPNPTNGNSTVEFIATATGIANIELYDITGRRIGAAQNLLTIGTHSYQVSGLRSGIYTLRIYSQAYTYTGKLVSNGAPNSAVKIIYLGNSVVPVTVKTLKSASTEKTMQYNDGEILKFTGTSGNYSTIVTDIPTQSKTLILTFFACTDADGKNYQVVQIGTQFWMSTNLNVTKYNDGTEIPNVGDNNAWASLTTGGYCNYDNTESYATTYGRLYNCIAVYTDKLAPKGWHVPSKDEWSTLIAFLGGESIAGGKLKATGSSWASPNAGATNETGFAGLPGGDRSGSGGFASDGGHYSVGEYGIWWSSTFSDQYSVWHYVLSYDGSSLESSDSEYGTYSNFHYGKSVRCIKDINIITVNTNSVSNITTSSAILWGDITYDGGTTVTERGICYSTSKNPTISSNKIAMGNGVGIFTNTITGLTPTTIYYVRAYAKNSEVTNYGNEISFKTFSGTVTDIDGNVYNTVTIGTQDWMVENLKTTKFNDDTSIPNVTDNTTWGNLSTPGYCWHNNDIAIKSIYGAFYNWYAINTGKLAPVGWHVPSDAEWTTLTTFLGGEDVAGGKLKETSTNHWKSPNEGATNETGFTALPGSYRNFDGLFSYIGDYGYWWSSAEFNTLSAWSRVLGYSNGDVDSFHVSKSYGLSVRCVKNVLTIPIINTIAASSITIISAICGGDITSDGWAPVTERGICYSTNQNPTTSNNKIAIGSSAGAFSDTITGLSPNTTYYIRAYATNSVGTAYGNELSFRTYTAGSETITDIDGNVYHTVTIGTQVWLVENLKTTKLNDGTKIPNVTGNDAWYTTTPGYCWYNDDVANKNTYGALYNWYTVNTGKLAPIGWHVASDAEWTTLTTFLGGEDVAGGKLKETGTSHWQSPNIGATNETGFTALPGGYGSNNGTYSSVGNLANWFSTTELITYSTWYGELKRDSSTYWGWANVRFSVRCVKGDVPVINTTAASNITSTSATLGGNVSNDWGVVVTARGVCWNTTGNPTLADDKTTDGTGTGSFISNLTNLTGSNTYYVRAYATNSVGTAYGNEITITTPDRATVTTSAITGITSTSAICGGNVTNDGGATVTERGVCYSTSKNPTISNSKMNIGSGKGTFTKTITSLAPSTTYYIRAYATNSVGTGYGNELILKTFTGTVTDIDGNVYNTVTIGTQVWMVENLKTTHYRNGAAISYITDNTDWTFMENGAYCNYDNNSNNAITYGKLYNWYAVSDARNVAPTGWHVPNNAEWTTLTDYLTNNGNDSEGSGSSISKSLASTSGWTSSSITGNVGNNQASNNSSGFTGLPSGKRILEYWYDENAFFDIGNYGYWWSSSNVYKFNLSYDKNIVTKSYSDKEFGYSVRCIKDDATETVTDIDGNVYNTVTIGTQVWMAENLKTTKFNDGTSITNQTDDFSWNYSANSGYCWYDNDIWYKDLSYGALYNWYAVNTGKLAPVGWHVASDAEWTTLITYLGGESIAGGKLKDTETVYWESPNTGATNQYSFTAYPGGARNKDGTFLNLFYGGYWWSLTSAWSISYDESTITNYNFQVETGCSVRCIKD